MKPSNLFAATLLIEHRFQFGIANFLRATSISVVNFTLGNVLPLIPRGNHCLLTCLVDVYQTKLPCLEFVDVNVPADLSGECLIEEVGYDRRVDSFKLRWVDSLEPARSVCDSED